MKKRLHILALVPFALGGILVATANAFQGRDLVDVREAMQQDINPATMEIWDIGNNAMDENGGIDPAQMTPEDWARLDAAARGLAAGASQMTNAFAFVAASPENIPEQDEPDAVSMEDVQRYIDADPESFRAAALALAEHAGLLADAARARDAVAAGDLVGQLDQVCETCHAKYWYPDQQ